MPSDNYDAHAGIERIRAYVEGIERERDEAVALLRPFAHFADTHERIEMSDRKEIMVTVFHNEIFGSALECNKNDDDTLQEWLSFCLKTLEEIPQEYRASARVSIESVGGYEGEHHAEISVYYCRPESDEEMANRLQAECERAAREEREERATLAALQRKYGGA